MPRKVSPVPKGYHTATPQLVTRNAAAAIEFYKTVFDATELSRSIAADGVTILRAELKIGNSVFHLSDEIPAYGIMSPATLGGVANATHLYLADVDGLWARAVEAGVTVILALDDMYWGERYGKFIDPFGHVWSVAKRLEILSEEEIRTRAEAVLAPASVETEMPVIDIAEALGAKSDEQQAEEILATQRTAETG